MHYHASISALFVQVSSFKTKPIGATSRPSCLWKEKLVPESILPLEGRQCRRPSSTETPLQCRIPLVMILTTSHVAENVFGSSWLYQWLRLENLALQAFLH